MPLVIDKEALSTAQTAYNKNADDEIAKSFRG